MSETGDIRSLMERFGRQVMICQQGEEDSEPFGAFIQPLRYKNKMYLGGVNTRIGFNREGRYLYLGPPEHDLTALPHGAWITCGDERYTIDRAEMVYIGDEPSHIWAIIRAA